jgi:hypothetical protein
LENSELVFSDTLERFNLTKTNETRKGKFRDCRARILDEPRRLISPGHLQMALGANDPLDRALAGGGMSRVFDPAVSC